MFKLNYRLMVMALLAVLSLAACSDNGADNSVHETNQEETGQVEDASDPVSEDVMDEEVSLDLQQVLNEELADEDPVTISELSEDNDKLFLYGPEAQEPFQVDGSIAKYAIFYSLNGDSLQVGFSEFDQETETPVLGSSDFKRNIEAHIVDGAEVTETSILLDAGDHTFEATPVSENKVEDQNGNIYTVYETTIDELLEDYQDLD